MPAGSTWKPAGSYPQSGGRKLSRWQLSPILSPSFLMNGKCGDQSHSRRESLDECRRNYINASVAGSNPAACESRRSSAVEQRIVSPLLLPSDPDLRGSCCEVIGVEESCAQSKRGFRIAKTTCPAKTAYSVRGSLKVNQSESLDECPRNYMEPRVAGSNPAAGRRSSTVEHRKCFSIDCRRAICSAFQSPDASGL
jgi:hypothetical protein